MARFVYNHECLSKKEVSTDPIERSDLSEGEIVSPTHTYSSINTKSSKLNVNNK